MAASDDLIIRIRTMDAAQARAELAKVSTELGRVGNESVKTGTKTKQAGEKAKEASGHFRLFGSTLGGLKFAAGAAGFTGLAFGIKDAIDAGVSLQAQQVTLRQSLKNAGIQGSRAFGQINDAAEKLSMHGGFGVTDQLQGLTQLVTVTKSSSQATKLNAAATDLARGAHLGYAQAVKLVTGAIGGSARGLSKYVGILQPVKTHVDALTTAHKINVYALGLQAKAMGKLGPQWLKQEELLKGINPLALQHAQLLDKQATAREALGRIEQRFRGQTATSSYASTLSNLKNTLDVLLAKVGTILLPLLSKAAVALVGVANVVKAHWSQITAIVGAVARTVWGFAKAIFGSKTAVQALISVAAPLAAIWAAFKVVNLYKDAITGVKSAMVALRLATVVGTEETIAFDTALDANPIGLIVLAVAALVAALIFLVMHFKAVRKIAGEAFQGIEIMAKAVASAVSSAFNAMITFIKHHWQLMLIILTSGLAAPVLFIIDHFHQIMHVAGSVVSGIEKVFGKLWTIITFPFRKAFQYIKGGINGLLNAFRWLVGKVKSVVSTIIGLPGKIAGGIGHAAGGLLNTATFGLLHTGGEVKPHYYAYGGPVGSDTVPGWLSPGEYVLNRATTASAGVSALNAWNSGGEPPGGGQNITITPSPITLKLDSRTLAEGVLRYTVGRAARGKSTLAGGSLVTG